MADMNILLEWVSRRRPERFTQKHNLQKYIKAEADRSLRYWRKGLASLLQESRDGDPNTSMPFFISRARRRIAEYQRLSKGELLITGPMIEAIEGRLDEPFREAIASLLNVAGSQAIATYMLNSALDRIGRNTRVITQGDGDLSAVQTVH